MARTPSLRELVAILLALAESDEPEDQELEEFLVAHSSQLEQALHTPAATLLALTAQSPISRINQVREAVRQVKERQQAAQFSAAQNLSQAAATMLALSAAWDCDGVKLDARIALGRNLLADRTRKFFRFDVEGNAPVVIRREKLSEAAKALKFPDVTCSVNRHGLRFGWRAGKGGLVLVSQNVDARHRDAVLSVVIVRPRPALTEPQAVRARARARPSSWFGEVFGDLTAL
jgi:hypothetical protein